MTQTLLPVLDPPPDTKTYLKISATQLDTFAGSRESCNRKWYFGYVLKLPTLQNKSAQFGSRLHEVLERWFKADDHGTVADLYPAGWNEGLTPHEEDLVRRLVTLGLEAGLLAREPDREVESEFFFNLIDEPHLKVDIIGYRDLVSRSRWLVTDHKSTGAGDYAKTDYTLPRTTQMPIYGISLVVEAMAKGQVVPPEVFVEHNIFCTAQSKGEKREGRQPRAWKVGPVPIPVKGRRRPSFVWFDGDRVICERCADALGEEAKTTGPVHQQITDEKQPCMQCGHQALVEDDSTPSLEEQLEVFLARARAMADVKQIQGWQNVRGPLNVQAACNAFGGCPYQRLCSGMENVDQYKTRLAMQQAALDKENKPAEASAIPAIPEGVQGVPAPFVPPPPAPIPASSTPLTDLKEHKKMSLAMLRKKPATNGTAPAAAAPIPNTPPPSTPPPPAPAIQAPPTQPTNLAALLSTQPPATPTLTPQPPQVNPNPVPPAPVMARTNPNQAIMPWAVQGCMACKDGPVSHGVASAGRPCVVCDGIAEQDGKPYASRWYDWKFENGILTATPKAGTQAPSVSAATPHVPVPTPAAPTQTAVVSTPDPAPQSTLTITPVAPGTPTSATILGTETPPPAAAPAEPVKKRRGRPPKNAQAPAATTTTTTPSGATLTITAPAASLDTEEGFTLCIGCRPLRRELTLFDDLWTELTSIYAKKQGVASFYALKPFERTDRLVEEVGAMAELLGGQTIYVPAARSPEQTNLVSALRALASEVYEA